MMISSFMPHTTIWYNNTTIYKSIRRDPYNSLNISEEGPLHPPSRMCKIGVAVEALSYSHHLSYTKETILPDLGTAE